MHLLTKTALVTLLLLSAAKNTYCCEPLAQAQRPLAVPHLKLESLGKDYMDFLDLKLVYQPDLYSNEGRIEWPIKSLANPLNGEFDLSPCGETVANALSIYTGYRKNIKMENMDKMEIWITQRRHVDGALDTNVIEGRLETNDAPHLETVFQSWEKEINVGLFFNHGEWSRKCFDYNIVTPTSELLTSSLGRLAQRASGGCHCMHFLNINHEMLDKFSFQKDCEPQVSHES